MLIEDIMSKNVRYLKSYNSVGDALEIFEKHNYKSIPITNSEEEFIGIINLRDLIGIKKENELVNFKKDIDYVFYTFDEVEIIYNSLINKKNDSVVYIINDNKRLVGILTKKDIINMLINIKPTHISNENGEKTIFDLFKNSNIVEAFNNMNEGVVVIDNDTKVIFANKSYTKMMGISFSKVINRYLSKVEPKAKILEVIKTGIPIINEEISVESVGVTIVANITPITNRHQERIGAISSFSNITEIINLADKLKKAEEKSKLYENELSKNRNLPRAFNEIIGNSINLIDVLKMACKISKYDASVLIIGENGTGKELLAKAIHETSKRKNMHFIKINCSAIPENLIESELFGYEEGAFTGAKKGGKKGKIEIANGGTLFLDEIGDMPLFMQPKLLRFLQEGELEKVGGVKTIKVDVRVISATNKNLKEMIKLKMFREDLFYRINIFTLKIPSLSERKVDILMLIRHFEKHFNGLYNKDVYFSNECIHTLLKYNWPGNVRELKNIIERCILLTDNRKITSEMLPVEIINETEKYSIVNKLPDEEDIYLNLNSAVRNLEIKMIKQAMDISKTKSDAIELLGISRRTFYKKIKEYSINLQKCIQSKQRKTL